MDFKTNYIGHDGIYKKRRQNDFQGWGETAEGYDRYISEVKEVIDHGNAPSSGKVLEIGCGAGNISIWFAQQGYKAHGMDIAPSAIEWAKEKALEANVEVDFRVGNVVHLEEYQDESFDFVFDGHCLHCIIGDDRATLLNNVHRVLKPGGYCFINTMCTPVDGSRIDNYDPKTRCTFHDGFATRFWGHPEELVAEMEAAKFEVIWSDVRLDKPDNPNYGMLIELKKK